MEKVTKNLLKSIVKECLVEILSEGIGASSTQPLIEQSKKTNKNRRQARRNLSETSSAKPESKKRARNEERVVNTASSITDDPILRDMLVDTARTTLPNQLNADRSTPNVTQTIAGRPGADKAAVLAESANPEDLFGEEAAGKWASLAFGG
tara:strand:+ start:269 stop:721 length:453 start_codon:yes stop_codon:yes gene_type:complete